METYPRVLPVTWIIPPGNSESVIVFDTTRMRSGVAAPGSITAGSPFFAPGEGRNRLAGYGFRGTIECAGQPVTAYADVLTGNAGTSADWDIESAWPSGIVVSTGAGNGQTLRWIPSGPDFRLRIAAGASGPSGLVVRGYLGPTDLLIE
jgi:hypothetical protein